MTRLRTSPWADLDPIEKHTTILDGLRATSACFTEAAPKQFRCGSEAEASWYGMSSAYWLRHLLAMQNTYARERQRYFKTHRQGYNYVGKIIQQQPYENFADPTLTGYVAMQSPEMSEHTNMDGRRVVQIDIPATINGVHERSVAMLAVAGVLTQLYVHGNCVQLHCENPTGNALVRHLLSHLIEHYECLEVVQTSASEKPMTNSLLAKTLQNSWVLLPDTWLVPEFFGINARVARMLAEGDARIIFYDPAHEKNHIEPIKAEIKRLSAPTAVDGIQWMPTPNLIDKWPEVVVTHCASFLVGYMHEWSFKFKQQLYEHTHGNAVTPRREHDPLGDVENPNMRSIRGSRRNRSTRSASVAVTKSGLGLPVEEVRPASVVGINCSALDVLHCYPQLPFAEGRVGNTFRLQTAQRAVLRRPFNSLAWFDGVGGGGWANATVTSKAGVDRLVGGGNNMLRQERLVQYLQDTMSARRLLPFLVSRVLRF